MTSQYLKVRYNVHLSGISRSKYSLEVLFSFHKNNIEILLADKNNHKFKPFYSNDPKLLTKMIISAIILVYYLYIELLTSYMFSIQASQEPDFSTPLPKDPTKLHELRKNISMELLWIQQAIDSRKNVSCWFMRIK